jgi:sec-independent protein translocase protein TatC
VVEEGTSNGAESERDPQMGMPFLAHLEELRQTLLRIIGAIALGGIACWVISGRVLTWLINNTTTTAIFLKPQGAFLARLKVAIVLGILLTLPYSFYKLWSFIGPGLLDREKKVVLPGVLGSVSLFYLGILFSYFALTPVMVKVLMGFGTANLTAQTEVHFLLDLVFTMGLACGLVFQMPLLAAFLTGIGIVTPRMFRAYWRHAIVVMFIAAALLTPADPLSQILLALPLVLLYMVSYGVSTVIHNNRMRARQRQEDERRAEDEREARARRPAGPEDMPRDDEEPDDRPPEN